MRGLLISLFVLSAFVFRGYAQDQINSSEKFVYGIENVSSLEQVNSLERSVLALDFVSQLKFDIKLDKGTARMEFTVVHNESDSEGRDNIDLAVIKRLIIEGGMTPIECVKVN